MDGREKEKAVGSVPVPVEPTRRHAGSSKPPHAVAASPAHHPQCAGSPSGPVRLTSAMGTVEGGGQRDPPGGQVTDGQTQLTR
ncbi:hypothetical protein GCM10009547_36920 [Sporichthya brevicatena]|uniref:Uncharacterized protein n=1 Tax=Sporichthya brevicatena TaxID=171442 RepID=A0ABN1H609_9ACTN